MIKPFLFCVVFLLLLDFTWGHPRRHSAKNYRQQHSDKRNSRVGRDSYNGPDHIHRKNHLNRKHDGGSRDRYDGHDENDQVKPLDERVFCWIPKALNNPVFDTGAMGARQSALEIEDAAVRVEYVGPEQAVASEQAAVLRDCIARGVEGIAVSCLDEVECGQAIDEAVRAKIPVITWDSDAPKSQRLTFIGVNNTQAGIEAANLFAVFARDKGLSGGTVGVLTGVESSVNLRQRVDGFIGTLQALEPSFNVTTIAYTDEDATNSAQPVQEMMINDADLVGIFFAGPWPFFGDYESHMPAWTTAADAGSFVSISFDTLPELLDLVRQERVQGLVGQKYWGWGYDSVKLLHDITNGGTVGAFTNSGYDLITRCNVEEIQAAWDAQIFPGVDFISRQPYPDC